MLHRGLELLADGTADRSKISADTPLIFLMSDGVFVPLTNPLTRLSAN